MITTIEREHVSEHDWDTVVRDSDDGWVFALHAWQDLILHVLPWGLEDFSFAVEAQGKLVAVVPLQFSPGSRTLGMSAWGGCGPILSCQLSTQQKNAVMATILERCRSIAERKSAIALEYSQMAVTAACLANDFGVNHALFHGFEDRSGLTQVIDLTRPTEQLWSEVSKNARNIIRRAEKEGIRAELVNWGEHLQQYYAVHCETYIRTGVTPHPFSYFSGIAESIAAQGHAQLLAAIDADNTVIAYHNDAYFGPGALYHTGCSIDSAQDKGANYLLLWKAILAAKEAGKLAYEVGPIFPGSMDAKQKGLTLFKTRFGGSPRRAFRSLMPYSFEQQAEESGTRANDMTRSRMLQFLNRVRSGVLRRFPR